MRALLSKPHNRRKHSAFLAEGVRLIEEGIQESYPIQFILFSDELSKRGRTLLESLPSEINSFQVETHLLKELSDTETTQGILAVFNLKPRPLPQNPDFLLIADGIRDPGNLGTILRIAEAAGVQGVLMTRGTTDVYAPKVVRAGMGAHFRLSIQELDWEYPPQALSSLAVFSAEMHGDLPYWQADLRKPCAILIGGEAQGVSRRGQNFAHQSVQIPMPGKSESLNAAVATAILLFEVVRQRSTKE
ncbi:MAG: RNA methyltransferase [Chloroflexota bacterium]